MHDLQPLFSAVIQFDALGFFRRPTQPNDQFLVNASAVTFHTENGRYHWLNEVTGMWQGTFDMAAWISPTAGS